MQCFVFVDEPSVPTFQRVWLSIGVRCNLCACTGTDKNQSSIEYYSVWNRNDWQQRHVSIYPPRWPQTQHRVYINILEEILLPLLKWVLLKDPMSRNMTLHPARQTYLSDNTCDHINRNSWAPNSANCSTIDYYVLSKRPSNHLLSPKATCMQESWKHSSNQAKKPSK